MRKVLFWVLIAILLFLLVVLGVSFWTNRTPINVLRDWFGVKQSVVEVQEIKQNTATGDTTSEKSKRDLIRESLEAQAAKNQASGSSVNTTNSETTPTSDTTTSVSTSTSTSTTTQTSAQKENTAAQNFVDNLIVK